MKSIDLSSHSSTIAMNGHQTAPMGKQGIRIKELSERDRRRLLMHFLGLSDNDRLLRFGTVLSNESITRYVQRLDFSRDAVFGVFNDKLELVGVGHLVFMPRDAVPVIRDATLKSRIAEFGVSVSASARGIGIGSRLFERAAIHCRNEDVDTLHMYCLSSNQIMIHIARKAGMEIHGHHDEVGVYLKLAPINPGSMLPAAFEEEFASRNYKFKPNTKVAAKWWKNFPGQKRK